MDALVVLYTILWNAQYSIGVQGAVPVGLTSLRKCNEYYNIGKPEDGFSPLTKKELDELNEGELDYDSVYAYAGGVDALPTELPFMAALGYADGNQKQFACGGTLISDQFVLTAAHCIESRSWGKVKYIRIGDLNLTSSTDDEGAQEFQLKDSYVHPNYTFPLKYHDIALIKLDRPIAFTNYVSPACLEPKRVYLRYSKFVAAGWGRLGDGLETSDHLQVGNLWHYRGAQCKRTFPQELTIPEGVKIESQICAGGATQISDTCEDDSGGPLSYKYYYDYPKFIYMIAGITSFGKACAVEKIPAIYTRVSYYTEWIEKLVWPDEFKAHGSDKLHFPGSS